MTVLECAGSVEPAPQGAGAQMRTHSLRFLVTFGACLASPWSAGAAEVTRVASAFEDGNRFDIHFGLAYDYNYRRASILREWSPSGDLESRLVKDLIYRQHRQTLTPQLEIGLWNDLAFYAALPIVVSDNRSYGFDQSADDCVYGDGVPPAVAATCVNKANSTTLRDEILPRDGIDAQAANPFGSFTGPGTEQVFAGPTRRGLDQLHLGFKYGILNQEKRSHVPTWIIAAEGRFAVGRPMTFSRDLIRDNPVGNRRVGRGIHEIGIWTALSRRHLFLDPFFHAYWRQSLRAAGSKFQDLSDAGAQGRVRPQSSAGATIGVEVIPFERKAKGLKVGILVSASADLHYGGRGYSEIWELLADSPALVGAYDPTPQAVDAQGTPLDPGYCNADRALAFARQNPGSPDHLNAGGASCRKFEGITDLQDYASFNFHGAVNLNLGPHTMVNLGLRIVGDTSHFVTFAARGSADANDAGGTDPNRVEPGTAEVNPLYRSVVDAPGQRYAVADVLDINGYLRVLVLF